MKRGSKAIVACVVSALTLAYLRVFKGWSNYDVIIWLNISWFFIAQWADGWVLLRRTLGLSMGRVYQEARKNGLALTGLAGKILWVAAIAMPVSWAVWLAEKL